MLVSEVEGRLQLIIWLSVRKSLLLCQYMEHMRLEMAIMNGRKCCSVAARLREARLRILEGDKSRKDQNVLPKITSDTDLSFLMSAAWSTQ